MRIRWLRRALRDMDEIATHIARDDPETAKEVFRAIRSKTLALKDAPAMGRPGRLPGTRELVLPSLPFILPYKVENQEIRILRVLHTRRRPI